MNDHIYRVTLANWETGDDEVIEVRALTKEEAEKKAVQETNPSSNLSFCTVKSVILVK